MSNADGVSPVVCLSGQLWLQLVFAYLSLPDLFRFRRVSREALHQVNDYFRRLTRLDLSTIRMTNLRFTWNHFLLITRENVSLRTLNLANAFWIDEVAFSKVLQRQDRLVSLDLSGACQVTNETLQHLAMFCPILERLSLRHCSWLNADTFLMVLNRCSRLKEIDVASCWSLNDHCVDVLFATHGATLRRVGLSNIYSLTDLWTRELDALATSLIFLDISFCWRITDSAIENIRNIECLEQIVLTGCSQISLIGHRRLLESGIEVVNSIEK